MVGISAIAKVLGDSVPASKLQADGVDRRSLVELLARGIYNYSESKISMFEMALESAKKTIESSKHNKDDIDVLLLLTNSSQSSEFSENFGHRLLTELELHNAYLHGACYQDCGDLILGLKTAKALILSKEALNVLVVVVDKVFDGGYPRLVGNSVIHGDAASSCIVSESHIQFKLGPIVIRNNTNIQGSTDSILDFEDGLKSYSVNITKDVMAQSNISLSDIVLVITNNFNRVFSSRFSQFIGVRDDIVFTENISKTGHCLASDILINLSDIGHEHKNGPALLFASSKRSYGALIIEI